MVVVVPRARAAPPPPYLVSFSSAFVRRTPLLNTSRQQQQVENDACPALPVALSGLRVGEPEPVSAAAQWVSAKMSESEVVKALGALQHALQHADAQASALAGALPLSAQLLSAARRFGRARRS